MGPDEDTRAARFACRMHGPEQRDEERAFKRAVSAAINAMRAYPFFGAFKSQADDRFDRVAIELSDSLDWDRVQTMRAKRRPENRVLTSCSCDLGPDPAEHGVTYDRRRQIRRRNRLLRNDPT